MKKQILIALALIFSVGVVDIDAQNFLKKLEKTVKKEVENRVSKEAKKQVNKGIDNTIQIIKGDGSQTQTRQTQSQPVQKQKVAKNTTEEPTWSVTGKLNGHEWVDMGLPSGTKWATCNVGATSPEQPGKHYAWGEVTTKSTYTEGTSKFYEKSASDISGNKNYDVATLKWGDGWRMPTEEEFKELIDYCNWKYVQKNGRWGVELTHYKNGIKIFLPATGAMDGTKRDEPNGCGMYWTSTPYTQRANYGAHEYHFGAALGEMGVSARYYGYAIRPVTK